MHPLPDTQVTREAFTELALHARLQAGDRKKPKLYVVFLNASESGGIGRGVAYNEGYSDLRRVYYPKRP